MEVDCKYAGECKSKKCVFNHPGRKDCRKADACRQKDCLFNHAQPICLFFPECTKDSCAYRHPVMDVMDSKGQGNSSTGDGPRRRQQESGTKDSKVHRGWIASEEENNSAAKVKASTSHNAPRGESSQASFRNKQFPCTSSTDEDDSNRFRGWLPNDVDSIRENEDEKQDKKPKQKETSEGEEKSSRQSIQKSFRPTLVYENSHTNSSKNSFRPPSASGSSQANSTQNSFRQPSASGSSQANSTQRSSLPPLVCGSSSSPANNKHDQETNLLKNHEHQTKLVRDKLVSFLCDSSLLEGRRSSKTAETLTALRKQLDELSKQEKAYGLAVERAKNTLRGEELELQLNREAFRLKNRLPSLAERQNIENRLENCRSRFIVIQGQTGSGKSSQIAQYVADHPRFKGKRVVVTQPRKIAAISLANRVSEEYAGGKISKRSYYNHSRVGKYVGYHVGGRKRMASSSTRIEFVTEGVMLEKIMKGTKEAFQDIGCIVVDEAHERSIMCDILLGSFKNSKDPRWKDILIIVTSATIDLDLFSKFFNDTEPLQIGGRTFPVDITYCPVPSGANICTAVVECALKIHKQCGLVPGDILCFLPGQEDVLQATAAFSLKCQSIKGKNSLVSSVFALYGKQDPLEQAQVFEKQSGGKRKVIFATDVAETSLTIDGVVYVVDSGVRKEMMYDPKRNISSLKVTTISKSSAIQRAGRSGRTQPGHAYRLYSQDDYDCMDTSTAPEIFRKPLGLAILSLREMKIDPHTFEWISVPSPEAMERAEKELRLLGAVDAIGRPTDLGTLISISQQEPKLVRMIFKGCERGFGNAAIICASLLPIANIFFRGKKGDEAALKKRKELACPEGDVITMYELFQKWEEILEGREVDPVEIEADENEIEDDVEEIDLEDTQHPDEPQNTDWDFLRVAPLQLQPWIRATEEDLKKELENDDDGETSETDDTDDRKSISQLSEKSSALSTKAIARPGPSKSRKECLKLAGDFVNANYLNRKALGLVKDMQKELLLVFRNTKVWKSQPTQNNTPTREDLTRLIFSGYFLNVARLVHSKPNGRSRATLQYFGLVAGVNGTLDFKGAIGATSAANPPLWITFDKVLRLGDTSSVTLLTTATSVNDYMSWINEESLEFSEFCHRTCESLPTENIVVSVPSEECLRYIFGKFFANIRVIEDELECSLEVNAKSCAINAFVSFRRKPTVERRLAQMISNAVETLRHQFIEEEYMGSTRVVLGRGYDVQEILFPQEFITAYLRKLPRGVSDKDKLMSFLRNAVPTNLVHSVDIRYHDTSNFGIVSFKSKEMAGKFFPSLSVLCEDISDLGKKVGGPTKEKKFRAGEVARLKISWPVAPATGKIMVTFRTALQANAVIDMVGNIFFGARVTNAEGHRRGIQSKYPVDPKKQLPIVEVTKAQIGIKKVRFQFIPDVNQLREGLDYKITIANADSSLDEFEVYARLNRYNPKSVKVVRESKNTGTGQWHEELLDGLASRVQELEGIQRYTNALTKYDDFVDKYSMRGGVYVYLDDVKTTEEAHKELSLMKIPFPPVFNQPVRVEIEYTKTISVQWDLYEFLEDEINRVVGKARTDGIFVSKPNKNPNNMNWQQPKFAFVKLRHRNLTLVEKYQKTLLDEVLVCQKVPQGEHHSLFFSCVGKSKLEELGRTQFLHWDIRTQFIWVYGPNELTRKCTMDNLQQILTKLKALEVLDKEILMDKRKIDCYKDKTKIEEMAYTKAKVTHVQLIGRNRLLVSGTEAATSALEKILKDRGFLFFRRTTRNQGTIPDCAICFCECNEENIRLSECGHIFCLECIFPMLNTPKVPIACPSCEKPIVIADILKITNNKGAVLRKFVEAATLVYASKNKDRIVMCPKPGCNQILSLLSARKGPEGGEFVSCDECVSTYCIECSVAMEKPVLSHERDTCEEIRQGFGADAMRHVKEIQDSIFNLKCPRCKKVFLDYDGCASVTCGDGNCNASFCGMCLKDCGQDAHAHAIVCPLNPTNTFYVPNSVVDEIHQKKRTSELVEYLRKIQSNELRNEVIQALRKDLRDLGLVLPSSIITTMNSTQSSGVNPPFANRAIAGGALTFARVNVPAEARAVYPRHDIQEEMDRLLAMELEREERQIFQARQQEAERLRLRMEMDRDRERERQAANFQRIHQQNLRMAENQRQLEQAQQRQREKKKNCIIS